MHIIVFDLMSYIIIIVYNECWEKNKYLAVIGIVVTLSVCWTLQIENSEYK